MKYKKHHHGVPHKYSRKVPGTKNTYRKKDGTLYAQQHNRPMGDILAAASGVNPNTIYQLSKYINEYIEVKLILPDGSSN